LENERQVYENKLKEMLEQQDKLLKEKESLLTNFSEKQDRFERLLDKKEKKIRSRRPSKTVVDKSPRSISPILNVESKKERNFTKEIDQEIVMLRGKPLLNSTIINVVEKQEVINKVDDRKQHLIQQRLELVDEQNMLKHLIEQQERLLREKNVCFKIFLDSPIIDYKGSVIFFIRHKKKFLPKLTQINQKLLLNIFK
jgi:hypothetical protein